MQDAKKYIHYLLNKADDIKKDENVFEEIMSLIKSKHSC